jgi:prepilin-type N-terminal cleavage/methylation domain-containing protein
MSRRARRAGFTLIEVAVAAVLVALLAAVSVPQLIDFVDKQRAQTTANMLTALGTGISTYSAKVLSATGTTNTSWPNRLSELVQPIVSGTSLNSCKTAVNATQVTNWNTNGPFVQYYITGNVNALNALSTPVGNLLDTMTRSTASGTAGTLTMYIIGVSTTDATNLDDVIDGGDGQASGQLQWVTTAKPDSVIVKFLVPVGTKC